MSDALRFGLVGCGRIGHRHAELLATGQVPGAVLAAVCDVRPERAAAFADAHVVPAFADMHEMMVTAKIDVVAVLTESGNHSCHVIELARYGRPIVVEKPMALTLDDADAMIEACDRSGSKLFVVKQNRYNRPVQKLREAVDAGRLGKPVLGTVRVRWTRDQAYYDQDAWRGTWALDGGVFANQASHHIDLLEWFMGEPQSVYATTARSLVDIEAEDTGVAIIRFRNGALGVVEATTATRPRDLEGSISILGEFGCVEIAGFAVNEIRTWQFSKPEPEDELIMGEQGESPPDVYGYGHRRYLEHVVDAVQNGTPALVDGLEGRKSLELITAMYESAETGREVALRFRSRRTRLGGR